MKGTSLCVYGTAVSVYPITGNRGNTITRINFSDQQDMFFILSKVSSYSLSPAGTQQEIKSGDCIQVVDTVRINSNGSHQTPFMQVKQLLPCGK